MNRSKTMFFAFTGKPIEQAQKMLPILDGYECWDLKQFSFDEFIEEVKKRIPPVNNNVLRNYRAEGNTRNIFGLDDTHYEKASWGLLIPDTIEEGGFAHAETLFLLNIYSPHFLYPLFSANDMGITRHRKESRHDPLTYFHTQDAAIFQSKGFVEFYKTLLKQSEYGTWHLDRVQSWNKEDWRLFVAALLYKGLEDYENSKSSFGWQRESAEMATILEALFTAGDARSEEVTYRLRKRVAVLLAWKFPNIEKDIKELYSARSAFVHGSFFEQIAKESPDAYNNLPVPDFDLLYKHKEYVRLSLAAYMNLARVIGTGGIEGVKSAMEALEKAIIDTELRGKLIAETEKLFALMPEPKLTRM